MGNTVSWIDAKHYIITTEDGDKSYVYRRDGIVDYCEKAFEHLRHVAGAHESDTNITGLVFFNGRLNHR